MTLIKIISIKKKRIVFTDEYTILMKMKKIDKDQNDEFLMMKKRTNKVLMIIKKI